MVRTNSKRDVDNISYARLIAWECVLERSYLITQFPLSNDRESFNVVNRQDAFNVKPLLVLNYGRLNS